MSNNIYLWWYSMITLFIHIKLLFIFLDNNLESENYSNNSSRIRCTAVCVYKHKRKTLRLCSHSHAVVIKLNTNLHNIILHNINCQRPKRASVYLWKIICNAMSVSLCVLRFELTEYDTPSDEAQQQTLTNWGKRWR